MKQKDDKKLEAIAVAVYRLTAQRGLVTITLADIAREARIATSTLYVYYKSREELLDDVYKKAKTAAIARCSQNDDPAAPLKSRMRQIWNNLVDNRIENHQQVAFLEQYCHSDLLNDDSRAVTEAMIAPFHEILVAGQKDEQLKPLAPVFLAAAVFALAKETALLISEGSLADDENTRTNGFRLCWDAIRA
jgi:TetR/AcrR family transcriptional repressor of multidrug resistance operon